MDKFELGKVVRLHGYMGQMKIATKFDKGFDIKKIEKVSDGEIDYDVVKIFAVKDGVVVMLSGINGEDAKKFIGKMLYGDRNLFDGKILIEDLKNSTVLLDDEKVVGKIFDVQDFGAGEVFFVMQKGGKELMFPNVKGLIVSFDRANKTLVVDKNILSEVSEYED